MHLATSGEAAHSPGEVVAQETDNLAVRTAALERRIREIAPDVILCHALGDPAELNAIRYLPRSIPRVMVLHSSTLATYRGSRAVRDHVSVTVAISHRIEEDLLHSYQFQAACVQFVPHGIDIATFAATAPAKNGNARLRLLSHGRIDNNSKGLFLLPEILSQLARQTSDWECTISGDGPDLPELRKRVARLGLSDRVHFTGWTPSEDVPALMHQNDVFLFPSKFEGYPIGLIEAMAGGCLPIASNLPGITDRIIEDGVNGLLVPVGNADAYVGHILELLADRPRLAALRQRAQESVSRYSLDWMAEQYYQLFCDVLARPGKLAEPEALGDVKLAKGLRPAWWYGLPEPMKNQLRMAREKLRASFPIP